jgi:hypothetical protein
MRAMQSGGDIGFWQLLIGVGLVVGGIVLAVDGLGLQHTVVGQAVDTYWAGPFVLLGLYGILRGVRSRRTGSFFVFVAVTLAAGAFLVGALHLARINAWTLLWAAVLLTFGLSQLGPRRRGWRRDSFVASGWTPGDNTTDPDTRPSWQGPGDGRRFTQWMGDLRLDLGDFPLEGPLTRFEAELGLGDLTLLVPGTWAVKVVASAGLGEVRAYGRHAAGIGPRVAFQSSGYEDAPERVEVWAHVGIGDVDVQPF